MGLAKIFKQKIGGQMKRKLKDIWLILRRRKYVIIAQERKAGHYYISCKMDTLSGIGACSVAQQSLLESFARQQEEVLEEAKKIINSANKTGI
jgi:hypothetical protein